MELGLARANDLWQICRNMSYRFKTGENKMERTMSDAHLNCLHRISLLQLALQYVANSASGRDGDAIHADDAAMIRRTIQEALKEDTELSHSE